MLRRLRVSQRRLLCRCSLYLPPPVPPLLSLCLNCVLAGGRCCLVPSALVPSKRQAGYPWCFPPCYFCPLTMPFLWHMSQSLLMVSPTVFLYPSLFVFPLCHCCFPLYSSIPQAGQSSCLSRGGGGWPSHFLPFTNPSSKPSTTIVVFQHISIIYIYWYPFSTLFPLCVPPSFLFISALTSLFLSHLKIQSVNKIQNMIIKFQLRRLI